MTKLELADCEIEDISLLSRMSFNKLKTFDLSMNKIKNIEIFNQFRFEKLTTIYLNDNQITNIYSLIKIKSNNLKDISLKNNNLNVNNKITSKILKFFQSKDIEVDLNQKD